MQFQLLHLVIATPASPATYTATYQPAVDQGPQDFFTLPPCRVLDTRSANGPLGGPALAAGAERAFDVRGPCYIPATARAIAVNVTVTGASSPGHVRLWATGELRPVSSTINFAAGSTRANNAVLRIGTNGSFSVFCAMPSGSAHLVLDVVGYFE